MIRGFRQIAVLTALSRVLGFIRDITYSHFFGANALLDAWLIAFKIPNLPRRLFGEGAASASLIPVYSHELQRDKAGAKQLVDTVLTVLFVVLAGFVMAGEILVWLYYSFFAATGETKLILSLSSALLPYMVFVCIAAILGAVLNVHSHFAVPAATPIVLNAFIICSIPLASWAMKISTRQQLFFVAAAVLVAGIGQIGMHIPPLRASGVFIKPGWSVRTEAFKKILVMIAPMILGLTVTQINTLLDDIVAWCLSGSAEKGSSFVLFGQTLMYPLRRGSVSHLYYAQRLYQLPLGIFGISLATAIFPVMSKFAARKDFSELAKTVSKGLAATAFIALPSTVGLIAVAKPLISAAFQHGRFSREDTSMVVWPLLFYTLGLCGYFAQQVMGRAFYSMQESKTPVKSALLAVAVDFILNLTLVWFLGTGGLAGSTAICSYLQVIFLLVLFQRYLRKHDAGVSITAGLLPELGKIIAATGAMSAAAVLCLWFSRDWPSIFRLALIVTAGTGTYLGCAKLLQIEMLSLLTGGRKAQAANSTGVTYD
jgi:putative peptidoglycan lipid II flippase